MAFLTISLSFLSGLLIDTAEMYGEVGAEEVVEQNYTALDLTLGAEALGERKKADETLKTR